MKLTPRLKKNLRIAAPFLFALLLALAILPGAVLAQPPGVPGFEGGEGPDGPGGDPNSPGGGPPAGRPSPAATRMPTAAATAPAGPPPTATAPAGPGTGGPPGSTATATSVATPVATSVPNTQPHPSAPFTPPGRLHRRPCRHPGPGLPHRRRPPVLLHRRRRQLVARPVDQPIRRSGYARLRLRLQRHQSQDRQIRPDHLPGRRKQDPHQHLLSRYPVRHQQALQLHRRLELLGVP